jgi:GT2 family glycosyltransferase
MSPLASVVIPAYFSDWALRDCLESLRCQTVSDFETIVINSSPETRTALLVNGDFPEVVFEQSDRRLLPHGARNRGAARARGDMLVFTDPDCIARPDWLEVLTAAVRSGHPVVQGSMDLDDRSSRARAIHLVKWHALLPGLPARRLSMVATGNACYRRDVWEEVGPFDGDVFAGDAMLSWRAAERGHELWFEPRAVVAHRHKQGVGIHLYERLERGWEYGRCCGAYQRWSRLQALARGAALPLMVAVTLARAAKSAAVTDWLGTFLLTFPVQLLGQLSWCTGEAAAYLHRAVNMRNCE